jgi:hypothetical protein
MVELLRLEGLAELGIDFERRAGSMQAALGALVVDNARLHRENAELRELRGDDGEQISELWKAHLRLCGLPDEVDKLWATTQCLFGEVDERRDEGIRDWCDLNSLRDALVAVRADLERQREQTDDVLRKVNCAVAAIFGELDGPRGAVA